MSALEDMARDCRERLAVTERNYNGRLRELEVAYDVLGKIADAPPSVSARALRARARRGILRAQRAGHPDGMSYESTFGDEPPELPS